MQNIIMLESGVREIPTNQRLDKANDYVVADSCWSAEQSENRKRIETYLWLPSVQEILVINLRVPFY